MTREEINALMAGLEMDCAVALAMGFAIIDPVNCRVRDKEGRLFDFAPSRCWQDAGEVIERFRLALDYVDGVGDWEAWVSVGGSLVSGQDASPLVAVCRCALQVARQGESHGEEEVRTV